MKERPILFSAPMVRAILSGQKTQTRRIVKPCKDRNIGCELAPHELAGEVSSGNYGNAGWQPDDRLWLREAWRASLAYELTRPREIPPGSPIAYEADGASTLPSFNAGRLRPSMFMPRWASRITLEITGVRVARLNDISEEDAQAEGADCLITDNCGAKERALLDMPLMENGSPYRNGFALLWELINGEGSWAVNPWVWVVEFKRIAS